MVNTVNYVKQHKNQPIYLTKSFKFMKKFFAFVAAIAFAGSMMAATTMTCADAATAALSVSGNNVEYNNGEEIEVTGYVTFIQTAYSDQYHNITFWMADAADGGKVLEAYRAACATEADAPAVGDQVKVTGKLTKYGTTPEFAAGCTYVILSGAAPAMEYYVVGSMSNWAANASYKLAANPAVEGEYMGEFTFAANDEFKVAYSDGKTIADENWFPTGMGNNYVITEAGTYNVYFRPAGNSEWGNGFFTAIKQNILNVTVAEAIAAGMELDSMGVSTNVYAVEGYVINPGSFSMMYKNQSWYMADEAAATASDFQAFNCFPIQGNDTLKVLAGDKVRVVGKLKKYYNKSTSKYIIEIEKGNASFITMVDGDHTVVVVTEEVTVAQALTIGAALANNASTEKQYTIKGYVSAINVKSSDAWSDQYKNQSFWVMDQPGSGKTNAEGAFYVYRGKPENEQALAEGAYVEFTCTIKKYVPSNGGDAVIENADQNIAIKILADAPDPDPITVAEALEAANALGDNEESASKYAVVGYVAKIKTAYSEQYGNITFFMTDDATSTYGDLQVYRGKISAEDGPTLAAGDRVLVVGKLKKSVYESNGETKTSIEMPAGAQVTVEWKAAIENILMNDSKINKVMVDGVLYIVRDGKLYDVRGAQVR